jgi:hypothetical protein
MRQLFAGEWQQQLCEEKWPKAIGVELKLVSLGSF